MKLSQADMVKLSGFVLRVFFFLSASLFPQAIHFVTRDAAHSRVLLKRRFFVIYPRAFELHALDSVPRLPGKPLFLLFA